MSAVPPCITSAGHKIHGVAIDLRTTEELGGAILLIVCLVVLLASAMGFVEKPAGAKQPVWLVDAPQTILVASLR